MIMPTQESCTHSPPRRFLPCHSKSVRNRLDYPLHGQCIAYCEIGVGANGFRHTPDPRKNSVAICFIESSRSAFNDGVAAGLEQFNDCRPCEPSEMGSIKKSFVLVSK